VEIRVLGPVQVWSADVQIDAGPTRRRTVLAARFCTALELVKEH